MAHNSFIHGGTSDPTAWLPGYVFTQLDGQSIDQLLFESINGDQGGAWAPASAIVIGGAGVELDTTGNTFLVTGTGSANFFGGALVFQSAAATFYGGVLTITGTTVTIAPGNVVFGVASVVTFNNGFVVATGDGVFTTGNVDVQAGQLHVAGNVQFDANLSAAGTITLGDTFANSVTVAAGAIVIDNTGIFSQLPLVQSGAVATATFNAAVTIASTAPVALASILTPSGVGRVLARIIDGADANSSYGPQDADIVRIPALGAPRTYTADTTGAVEGDRMRFTATANTTVNAATLLGLFQLANASGFYLYVDLCFHSGAWHTDAYYLNP